MEYPGYEYANTTTTAICSVDYYYKSEEKGLFELRVFKFNDSEALTLLHHGDEVRGCYVEGELSYYENKLTMNQERIIESIEANLQDMAYNLNTLDALLDKVDGQSTGLENRTAFGNSLNERLLTSDSILEAFNKYLRQLNERINIYIVDGTDKTND